MAIQIPIELTPGRSATPQVIVDGQPSAATQISIGASSPGWFFSGTNVGVITHANGTLGTTRFPWRAGLLAWARSDGLVARLPQVPIDMLAACKNLKIGTAHTLRMSHTTRIMITIVPTIPYPNIQGLLLETATPLNSYNQTTFLPASRWPWLKSGTEPPPY